MSTTTTQTTMSITRALASLKALDAKINRAISTTELIGVTKGLNSSCILINGSMDVEAKSKEIESGYKSIMDMIAQRESIKSKVMKSNATTEVKVGNLTMTVAEAIERKNSIEYKKTFLSQIKAQAIRAQQLFQSQQNELEAQVENAERAYAGKDRKIDASELETVTKPIINKNKPALLDPLDLLEKVKLLTSEVEDFLENVDYALSESNALTTIEI